jgi:SAM-dependent methyltransferase
MARRTHARALYSTTMSEQYDEIADLYHETIQGIPFREHAETFTLFRTLGSVQGLSALDLACGTGYYARLLRERGATRVVGVDISPEMIRVGRSIEEAQPLGIEYHVADAANLAGLGTFDRVVAVYLLSYATSRPHLDAICRSIAGALVPGGRFVTYTMHPALDLTPGYYTRYAADVQAPAELVDGRPYSFTLTINGHTTPPIELRYWTRATLEDALRQAGFTSVREGTPGVSGRGLARFGRDYWQPYLDRPHALCLEAIRS